MSWKGDVLHGTLDLIKQLQREPDDWHRMTAVVARVLDAAPLKPAKDDCHDVA